MAAAATAGASSATTGWPLPASRRPPRRAPRCWSAARAAAGTAWSAGPGPGRASGAAGPRSAPASLAGGATPGRPPRSTPGPGQRRPGGSSRRPLIAVPPSVYSQGGAQQPPGPVRAALHRARRHAEQLGHLGYRPVLFVHQPPHLTFRAALRAQGRDRDLEVGPGQRGLGRVGPARADRRSAGSAAAARSAGPRRRSSSAA